MRKIAIKLVINFFYLLMIIPVILSQEGHGWTQPDLIPEPESSTIISVVRFDNSQKGYESGSAEDHIVASKEPMAEKESMVDVPQPSDEPVFGTLPSELPAVSPGSSIPYIYHGESVSLEDLRRIGGEIKLSNGICFYILYNNIWSLGPASFWLDDGTNSISYVDTPQYITYYEQYPDGHVVTRNWGYKNEGFYPWWFSADKRGWHRLAIWGSESKWSNVLSVYVR